MGLATIFIQCGGAHGGPSAHYLDSGVKKAVVALAPVQINLHTSPYAHEQVSWDLGEEITDLLHARLEKRGEVIILSPQHYQYNASDFRINVEILEHGSTAHSPVRKDRLYAVSGPVDHDLNIKYRLVVEDLRSGEPKVVLREIRESQHPVAKGLADTQYHLMEKGSYQYRRSPMGKAHARIANEVVSRLVDYLPFFQQS